MAGEVAAASRTAQGSAMARLGLDRPHTPEGDPDAQRKLCEGMEPIVWTRSPAPRKPGMTKGGRTHFFDNQVLEALTAGISQVVICGAGYDDRALRFRQSGVRYFEMDMAPTVADKARRLEAMGADMTGLTLAPADFVTDDVAEVLERHGHDAEEPSLFLCEGLLAFFEDRAIVRFLSGLASRAAAGSVLVATIEVHDEGVDSREFVAAANANKQVGRGTEPVHTILPRDAHLGLLEEAGWRVDQVDDQSGVKNHDIGSNMQLVTAVI